MEEFDGFGNAVFDPPSAGIVADQPFNGGVHVIGNQKGRFGMTVFADDDLPYHPFVVAQRDQRFINQEIGEFPFGMRDVNSLPGRYLIELVN